MIFRDKDGFLTNETYDGYDSCFRAGVWQTFGGDYSRLFHYADPILSPVRHPITANNRSNFTKDQLIPLMSGLYVTEDTYPARQIFWSLLKRGFLCFNTERDIPGSRKYPWPHYFYKDSHPNSNTVHILSKDKSKVDLELEGAALKGRIIRIERKSFDGPDPLFLSPHVLWFLARCARLHFMELLLAPVGSVWLFLNIYFQPKNISHESNQILCIVKTMGSFWVECYKKFNPKWELQVDDYWGRRNEIEYAILIKNNL